MPFVLNPDGVSGAVFQQIPGSPTSEEFIIRYLDGTEVALGRGTTDADITYFRSTNADGETVYIHGNADQDAVVIAATRP